MAGDDHLEQTWAEIQRRLRGVFSESIYEIWLARLEPVAISGGSLCVKAPDGTRHWVKRRLGASIEAAARGVDPQIERVQLVDGGEIGGRGIELSPTRSVGVGSFKPAYTFDRFVIGESNRFAHAAALAVAELPAQAYNPLFVHGPPGVGKTHLLQAIGNYIALYDSSLSIHYVTVEAFTNEFMSALKQNDLTTFKATYRQADVLLLDDVQFLEGKQKTAEEFFHTLDALTAAGGQAVLSSDTHPAAIEALEPRLRERFQSGLIVDLDPPDYETRLAILHKLAASNPSDVNSEVLEHMAQRISSNVRVLEGAFIRVIAFASLVESQISVELADRVLAHLYGVPSSAQSTQGREPQIQRIQHETAAHFHLDIEALCSSSRSRDVVYARQLAMYLCRQLTSSSLPAIAREFGGRDHTTVLYACRKIAKQVVDDANTQTILSRLTRAIQPLSQLDSQLLTDKSSSK